MAEESVTKKTIKTAFWGAIEKFFSLGVSFAVSMYLARLLDPSDYGSIALLTVFFAIANSVSECGFANALIRKEHCTQEDYSTAFLYNVGVNIALYVIIFISAPFIADFYKIPILCSVMRVSGLSMIITSVNLTQNVHLIRNLDFKKQTIISMVSMTISGISGIVAANYGMGIWSLVLQGLVASFLTSFLLVFSVRWKPSFVFSKDSFRYLWGFGSKMLLTGIISTLYSNIYSIVIGKYYNSSALGFFNRGDSLARLSPNIVASIFTKNTMPILSQLRNDHDKMLQVYRKYVILVSFINIPLCLLLAAISKPFILFFLTEKWVEAHLFVKIFCVAMMLDPVGAINLNIFQVEGRSDVTLKLEFVKKFIGFSLVFILVKYSPLVLAVGSACYVFIAFSLNLYYVNKLENLPYLQQISDIMPCLISGFIGAFVAYSFTLLNIPLWGQIVLGIFCGMLIYLLLIKFVFHLDVFERIREMIYSKIVSYFPKIN